MYTGPFTGSDDIHTQGSNDIHETGQRKGLALCVHTHSLGTIIKDVPTLVGGGGGWYYNHVPLDTKNSITIIIYKTLLRCITITRQKTTKTTRPIWFL